VLESQRVFPVNNALQGRILLEFLEKLEIIKPDSKLLEPGFSFNYLFALKLDHLFRHLTINPA